MIRHWTSGVCAILHSSSGDLRELAILAGADFRTVFRDQSLVGCDLRGQDLRGVDLTNCHIEGARIDSNTLIDPEFDPRKDFLAGYVYFKIHPEISRIIKVYAEESSYIYRAWAYKGGLHTCVTQSGIRQFAAFDQAMHRKDRAVPRL